MSKKNLNVRWLHLAAGVLALLFAGIIYGWSILKAPLAADFGWTADQLALNFTLTMCFFCLGGMAGGLLSKRIGSRASLILAGVLSCLGFFLTARLDGASVAMLYVSYGVLAGLGIGIAYNVIISTVNAWFPDKKGTCSGALMMGFGASALVVGNTVSVLMEHPAVGWRMAFTGLGAALGIILAAAGFLLRLPPAGLELPKPEGKAGGSSEDFEARDYTPAEMVRRFTFWRAFVCIVFLAAVGNTVISFARDLSISVGAEAGLATTLVGVLSVCNGLGRIATGAVFDKLGRRKTMLLANAALFHELFHHELQPDGGLPAGYRVQYAVHQLRRLCGPLCAAAGVVRGGSGAEPQREEALISFPRKNSRQLQASCREFF